MTDSDLMFAGLLKEVERHNNRFELGKNLPDDWFEPGMMENLDCFHGEYDSETNTILLRTEIKGLRYEGRTPRLEKLNLGDKVRIVREPENRFNSNNFLVLSLKDENLGCLSAELCNALAPAVDSGIASFNYAKISHIERIRDRSRYARQGIMFVELSIALCFYN